VRAAGGGGRGRCLQGFGATREEKRPHVKPRHRRKDIIKMNVQEIVRGTDWIDLAQDRDRLLWTR
jgi:hypothetical protein